MILRTICTCFLASPSLELPCLNVCFRLRAITNAFGCMSSFYSVLLRIEPRSQPARHPGHNRIRQQGREDNHVKQECDTAGESSRYRCQRPTQQQDQWVNANYANNHLLPKWWLFQSLGNIRPIKPKVQTGAFLCVGVADQQIGQFLQPVCQVRRLLPSL